MSIENKQVELRPINNNGDYEVFIKELEAGKLHRIGIYANGYSGVHFLTKLLEELGVKVNHVTY